MFKSLKNKIHFSIIILLVIISFIFGLMLFWYEGDRRANVVHQIERELVNMTAQKSAVLGNEIFSLHGRAVKFTIDEILKDEQIAAISVYDDFGSILYSSEKANDSKFSDDEITTLTETGHTNEVVKQNRSRMLVFTSKIEVLGEVVGFWQIKYSLDRLDKESMQIAGIFFMLVLSIASILIVSLNKILQKLVLNPVGSLKDNMDSLEELGLEDDQDINLFDITKGFDQINGNIESFHYADDELGSLASSFKNMISTLKSSYISISDAERKYRSIYENALEGLFQTNSDGKLISVNKAMAMVLGYEDPETIYKSISSFSIQCFDDINDYFNIIKSLLENRSVVGEEILMKRKGGTTFWASVNMRTVEDVSGKLLYYEGSIIDISERLEKEKVQRERESAKAAAYARREFLDNSGQGFLSFDVNMKISDEFSKECSSIFGMDIAQKDISELLFDKDFERSNFVKNINLIAGEKDEFRQDIYLSLLKKEYLLNGKYVQAEYKVLTDKRMMIILTDITHSKELENEIQVEKNRLKFIVTTVKETEHYSEILDDFERFYKREAVGIVESAESGSDALAELYRYVHTFKGHFMQQDFLEMPKVLHDFETKLSEQRYNEKLSKDLLNEIVAENLEIAKEALEYDKDIIITTLGDSLGRGSADNALLYAIVEPLEEVILNIEEFDANKLQMALNTIFADVNAELMRITLENYSAKTQSIAESKKVLVYPFEINIEKVSLNINKAVPFTKSLIHVFRNIVEHAAESADEREEKGKSAGVHISCDIVSKEDYAVLRISDDGMGIDKDAVLEQAVKQNLVSESSAELLDEKEIFGFIFSDGFSTKKEVTDLSGRGVGLSAVKSELEKIGGFVQTSSRKGEGTVFEFYIPLTLSTTGGA